MRKSKFSTKLIGRDSWKKFTKQFPEYKDMPWETFYQRWLEIAQTIREEAVTNPLGVRLGSYTGELKFQYLPYRSDPVAPKLSEELGEKTRHLNLINRGKVAKIKWERRWAQKFNKMLRFYAFEPTREINHMARDYIRRNPDGLRISRNTLGGNSMFPKWKKK
jgi:hypothetical protein